MYQLLLVFVMFCQSLPAALPDYNGQEKAPNWLYLEHPKYACVYDKMSVREIKDEMQYLQDCHQAINDVFATQQHALKFYEEQQVEHKAHADQADLGAQSMYQKTSELKEDDPMLFWTLATEKNWQVATNIYENYCLQDEQEINQLQAVMSNQLWHQAIILDVLPQYSVKLSDVAATVVQKIYRGHHLRKSLKIQHSGTAAVMQDAIGSIALQGPRIADQNYSFFDEWQKSQAQKQKHFQGNRQKPARTPEQVAQAERDRVSEQARQATIKAEQEAQKLQAERINQEIMTFRARTTQPVKKSSPVKVAAADDIAIVQAQEIDKILSRPPLFNVAWDRFSANSKGAKNLETCEKNIAGYVAGLNREYKDYFKNLQSQNIAMEQIAESCQKKTDCDVQLVEDRLKLHQDILKLLTMYSLKIDAYNKGNVEKLSEICADHSQLVNYDTFLKEHGESQGVVGYLSNLKLETCIKYIDDHMSFFYKHKEHNNCMKEAVKLSRLFSNDKNFESFMEDNSYQYCNIKFCDEDDHRFNRYKLALRKNLLASLRYDDMRVSLLNGLNALPDEYYPGIAYQQYKRELHKDVCSIWLQKLEEMKNQDFSLRKFNEQRIVIERFLFNSLLNRANAKTKAILVNYLMEAYSVFFEESQLRQASI